MIDEDFAVYLIEANTNACMETNSAILSRIIPVMLDTSFRMTLDPIFPPPDNNFKRAQDPLYENKYVMVFDESTEGEGLKNIFENGNMEKVETNFNDLIRQQVKFPKDESKQ